MVEDEISVFGKRTPSSSPKASTSSSNGSAMPRRGQFLGGDDAGDHAEIAVIAAAIDDGVDVRADEEPLLRSRPVASRRHQPMHGAGGVHAHGQAGPAHPLADQRRGALVLGRQVEPGQLAPSAVIVASASIIAWARSPMRFVSLMAGRGPRCGSG